MREPGTGVARQRQAAESVVSLTPLALSRDLAGQSFVQCQVQPGRVASPAILVKIRGRCDADIERQHDTGKAHL